MKPNTACFVVTCFLLVAGCSSVGPARVPVDSFDYNAAIATSQQEQLLLNLVRLRYREAPVFLRVSSVISQYNLTASADAGGGINTGTNGQNSTSAGGRLIWTDRPVITYMPISGQEFSRNLLTPLNPSAVFGLVQGGWPADIVFRTAIFYMNGLNNDIAGQSIPQQGSQELFEVMQILQRLRSNSAIGIRRQNENSANDGTLVLFLSPKTQSDGVMADIRRFRQLLGLGDNVTEIHVVRGLIPENKDEMAVLTGSIWDIMLNLAWQFNVPEEHVASGRTGASFRSARFGDTPPIQVHTSQEPPTDAFVTVYAQDHWFYIDQTDIKSKQIFTFLQLLLSLAETAPTGGAPIVTISN